MDSYDYLLKFLLIGNPATGKTCLLRWFLDGKFKEETLHTIGVEFGTKVVHIEDKAVKLQIWDTAGQERFKSVTKSYYRGAAGALVVYDVNDRSSYDAVNQWISSVRELALPNMVILLIGNKLDLAENSRQVSELEAQQFAEDNGIYSCMETSAKTGRNVQEAFITATRGILAREFLPKVGDMRSSTFSTSHIIGQMSTSSSSRCC